MTDNIPYNIFRYPKIKKNKQKIKMKTKKKSQ